MRVEAAGRRGVTAICAAHVKEEVVMFPQREIRISLRRAQSFGGIAGERHPAIDEQREEFLSGKIRVVV